MLKTGMDASKTLDALFPGPRRFILGAVFGEPDRWWTLAELAGRAGVQSSSLRPHVTPLREAGVLLEQMDNGKPVFQADKNSPVYEELRTLIGKLTPETEGNATIMVVEDQPATAQITRILLESWGYRVIEAHCGTEALGIFDAHPDHVHLLLTDVIMPGMTGPQLARQLLQRRPDLHVVYMSGYPSDELMDREAAFLPKPFNPASLARIIRKELDRAIKAR